MQALIVVDAQNEFSPEGQRPVHNHAKVLAQIHHRVKEARGGNLPIAWLKHYNKPNEPRRFVPKTWGAELSPGMGPEDDFGPEKLFTKDLFGAFTFTGLNEWLRSFGVDEVLIVGFFTHMCVSTTAREALVRGFDVLVDPLGTGTHDIEHPQLGRISAEEVHRTALLHITDMGVKLAGNESSFRTMAAGQAEEPTRDLAS